jgi:hypothetical protein
LANAIPDRAELCAFFPTLIEGLPDYSPVKLLSFIDDFSRDCATFSFLIWIVSFHISLELFQKATLSDFGRWNGRSEVFQAILSLAADYATPPSPGEAASFTFVLFSPLLCLHYFQWLEKRFLIF